MPVIWIAGDVGAVQWDSACAVPGVDVVTVYQKTNRHRCNCYDMDAQLQGAYHHLYTTVPLHLSGMKVGSACLWPMAKGWCCCVTGCERRWYAEGKVAPDSTLPTSQKYLYNNRAVCAAVFLVPCYGCQP